MSGRNYYDELDPEDCFTVNGLDSLQDGPDLWILENALPTPVFHHHFENAFLSKCEIIHPTSIPIFFICDEAEFIFSVDFITEEIERVVMSGHYVSSWRDIGEHRRPRKRSNISGTRISSVEKSKRVSRFSSEV